MANEIPEKLINFRVYREGNDMLGIADVELPNLEAMTDTVSGAGIAGEVDSPILGHYQSQTLTLNWRTVTGNTAALAAPRAHQLDLRGAMQVYNAGDGTYRSVPIKVVVRCIPKNTQLGGLKVGEGADASSEFEVVYLKVWVDGQPKVELDKYNYICVIDGIDFLAEVRENLGL